jgi:putative ABC transport system ATP-binding protein
MSIKILDQPNTVETSSTTTAPSPPIIQLQQLSKSYSEAGQTRVILDNLDLAFATGEFVCLVGKSGSGKSTLLNLISGIDAPTHGHVTIHAGEQSIRLTALSEHERTLFRRRHIGIVFQFFNLIPTLTVLENVTLPVELAGRRGNGRREAIELLERVGLGNRFDTYPDRLSGGEQQRVAIARALVHNPLLILADEPTGNLDEETGDNVLRLLLELTRNTGKTLIMATHAAEVAAQADRVLHLVHGKLVSDQLWRTQQAERVGIDSLRGNNSA